MAQTIDSTLLKKQYNLRIIENNSKLLNLIKQNTENKYNLYFAQNGKTALNKLKEIPRPHIIISGVDLDDIDGPNLLKELQLTHTYKVIPFILVTLKNIKKEQKIKILKHGAIDYLSKPFSIQELLFKIESILKILKQYKEEIFMNTRNSVLSLIKKRPQKYRMNNDKILNNYSTIGILFHNYGMSKKEIEVIDFLKQGLEYKEISSMLNISINTVETYIKSIYKKCKINSKMELLKIISK